MPQLDRTQLAARMHMCCRHRGGGAREKLVSSDSFDIDEQGTGVVFDAIKTHAGILLSGADGREAAVPPIRAAV
jgi:hypothetical protein